MRWVAALLLATVCLAGTAARSRAQSADLEVALLQPADIGPEWSEWSRPDLDAAQPQEEDGSANETTGGGPLMFCAHDAPDFGATFPEVSAQRWFRRNDERAILHHSIDRVSLAAGQRFMGYLRSLPLPCIWAQEEGNGEELLWEMEALPFPSLGDESIGFRMVGYGDHYGYEVDLVYVRLGELVTQVTSLAVDPPSVRVATAHTEALVRRAVERLAVLCGVRRSEVASLRGSGC